MRIASIVGAALVILVGGTAWAGCDWHSARAAKPADVLASAGTTTPPPVVQPERDRRG